MALDETVPVLDVNTIIKLDGMAFVLRDYDFVEDTPDMVATFELLDGGAKHGLPG